MATNFPASLDSLTNPAAGDSLSSPSHSAQHANVNDAVEALQAKVGVDGSAVTGSLDYKVANQGLTLVKSQAITGTPVSVSLEGVFTSTFENYLLVVSNVKNASVITGIGLRMRSGTTDTTTGYYWGHLSVTYGNSTGNTAGSNVTYWDTSNIIGTGFANSSTYLILGPQLAQETGFSCPRIDPRTGGAAGFTSGFLNNSTQYDGITVRANSGTFATQGTIRVYGYNNG